MAIIVGGISNSLKRKLAQRPKCACQTYMVTVNVVYFAFDLKKNKKNKQVALRPGSVEWGKLNKSPTVRDLIRVKDRAVVRLRV